VGSVSGEQSRLGEQVSGLQSSGEHAVGWFSFIKEKDDGL